MGPKISFDSQRLSAEIETTYAISIVSSQVLASFSGSTVPSDLRAASGISTSAWLLVRREVHSLLCTKSANYKKERELLANTSKPVIAMLTAVLVNHFGLPMGMAGALAALALLIPLKISVNAWCAAFDQNNDSLTQDEKLLLERVANGSREG